MRLHRNLVKKSEYFNNYKNVLQLFFFTTAITLSNQCHFINILYDPSRGRTFIEIVFSYKHTTPAGVER